MITSHFTLALELTYENHESSPRLCAIHKTKIQGYYFGNLLQMSFEAT
jgi:hypothetical protein